jgi:hypothetical protein
VPVLLEEIVKNAKEGIYTFGTKKLTLDIGNSSKMEPGLQKKKSRTFFLQQKGNV